MFHVLVLSLSNDWLFPGYDINTACVQENLLEFQISSNFVRSGLRNLPNYTKMESSCSRGT